MQNCYYLRVPFICFGFSEGDFIKGECLVIFDEEGGEVDIVASCGFHYDNNLEGFGEVLENGEEVIKSCYLVREFGGEKNLFVFFYAGGIEFVFRYIYTYDCLHFGTSLFLFFKRRQEMYLPLHPPY